jgi:hypothetical protein
MKRIFILLLTAVSGMAAHAQGGNFMISYPISFPMGDLHNYTTNVSFRGISLEFNKQTSHQTTAGLETGWNVFYQHVDKTVYKEGTASITGVQYRYTNAVPIIAGMKYYWEGGSKAVHPYIGGGIGTTYVDRTTSFGLYSIIHDAWQFTMRPELGVDLKLNRDEALFIGAKYFWNLNTNDLNGQSWLSINIGLRMSAL